MNNPSGQGKKVAFVLLGVAAVGALLFVLRPGSAPIETKPADPPPVAIKEPPPKPVEQPKEEPKEPPKEEPKKEPDAQEADAMKAALLGLGKKPQGGGINELAERAAQRNTVSASARPRRREVTAEEPNPPEEERTLGLSDSVFHSTLERWRGVKSCLTTGVRSDDGEPKGALSISLKISKSGEVTDCRVTEPSNEIARLIAPCVQRSAKQIRFPAFDGEESVTKTAKFVF